MSSFTNPSVSDFQSLFVRDFAYGSGVQNVQNNDIQTGLNDAANFINPNLFNSQTLYTSVFLNLAAHFMVLNMRTSGAQNEGLQSQWDWLNASKGAGPISESFDIPERIKGNPMYASLCKTGYGWKALNLMMPMLSGACFSVSGRTHG